MSDQKEVEQNTQTEPKYYTLKQVAQMLNVSYSAAQKLTITGAIKRSVFGTSVRVRADDFREYEEKSRVVY